MRWTLDNAAVCLAPEGTFEDDAEEIHKVFYEPLGVSAVITPWNFPQSNFASAHETEKSYVQLSFLSKPIFGRFFRAPRQPKESSVITQRHR
jgi:hypothetical protein